MSSAHSSRPPKGRGHRIKNPPRLWARCTFLSPKSSFLSPKSRSPAPPHPRPTLEPLGSSSLSSSPVSPLARKKGDPRSSEQDSIHCHCVQRPKSSPAKVHGLLGRKPRVLTTERRKLASPARPRLTRGRGWGGARGDQRWLEKGEEGP
jgi:hypothetical protein